jgi:hypothetical protein
MTSVSLAPFDNADSIPRVLSPDGVLARAFMLEYTLSGTLTYCSGDDDPALMDSIQLTSDRNFDALHPAGTDLKSLFIVNKKNNGGDDDLHTCYLVNAPSDTGTHVFTIKIFMHDSARSTFIASTKPVKLLL